jgi:multidrug efflux pump subunit AcrA (membrane-fusion protein)
VTRRNIDVGSLVQADATSGTFMFTLTQNDVLRTRLYVPQDAAIGVKPGVDAVVRVPEIPDHVFAGKVARIADALDPTTRTLQTEIDVANSDGELSPGIYCTVELKVPRRTPSLIVPAAAIVFDRYGLHRGRYRAQPHGHRNSRLRYRGRGQRRRQRGRSGRAHSAGESRGWQQSTDSFDPHSQLKFGASYQRALCGEFYGNLQQLTADRIVRGD